MKGKKYPAKYFWLFVLTNFIFRFGILLILGLILCFIGIWVRVLLWIGLGLFLLDFIFSVFEQLAIRKAVLDGGHPAMEKMLDEMNKPDMFGWPGKKIGMINVEARPVDEEE